MKQLGLKVSNFFPLVWNTWPSSEDLYTNNLYINSSKMNNFHVFFIIYLMEGFVWHRKQREFRKKHVLNLKENTQKHFCAAFLLIKRFCLDS